MRLESVDTKDELGAVEGGEIGCGILLGLFVVGLVIACCNKYKK